jgi:hypothetical protein
VAPCSTYDMVERITSRISPIESIEYFEGAFSRTLEYDEPFAVRTPPRFGPRPSVELTSSAT